MYRPRDAKAAASWAGMSLRAGRTSPVRPVAFEPFDCMCCAGTDDEAGSAEIRQPDPAGNGESTAASVFVALVFVQVDSCL